MEFDIVFLGGGPGGYEGAIAAGKRGLKAAVVEQDSLGGTCLQRGCIPTKNLLSSVKILKHLKDCKKKGIAVENVSVDLQVLLKNKARVVKKLTKGIEYLLNQYQVQVYDGKGTVIDQNTISVNGSDTLKAKNIVIATGSLPASLPSFEFDQKYIINSDHALELHDIPSKLLVIGAGAIGLEMGLIYHYLGSQVTIVEIMDHILPGSDTELGEMLKSELKKQGLKIFTTTSASNPVINPEDNSISLKLSGGEKEWSDTFSKVLLAVGRKPNVAGLTGPVLKLETDARGFVKVNSNLQTNYSSIYACGDVIGGWLLAHKASHQAISIVRFILDKKPIHPFTPPAAVFTFPEFASCGITEDEAKTKNLPVTVGRFPYSAGSKSNAIDEKAGLVKVIADEKGVVIGGHIIGEAASELIQLLNFAVFKKLKASDFEELVTIHPTLSENVWEAIGEVSGFSIHL